MDSEILNTKFWAYSSVFIMNTAVFIKCARGGRQPIVLPPPWGFCDEYIRVERGRGILWEILWDIAFARRRFSQ